MKYHKQGKLKGRYAEFYFYLGRNGIIVAFGIEPYDVEISFFLCKVEL